MVGRIIKVLGSATSQDHVPRDGRCRVGRAVPEWVPGGSPRCSLDVPLEIREWVTTARGWGWYAKRPIEEMRERGLERGEDLMASSWGGD